MTGWLIAVPNKRRAELLMKFRLVSIDLAILQDFEVVSGTNERLSSLTGSKTIFRQFWAGLAVVY